MSEHVGVRCGRGPGNCTVCNRRTWNSKTGLCRIHYRIARIQMRDNPFQGDTTKILPNGQILGPTPLTLGLNLGGYY